MSRTPSRLHSLFLKYARDTSAGTELEEFWDLIGQYGDGELLDPEMKAWWDAEVEGEDPAARVDGQKLFTQVLERGKASRFSHERQQRRGRRKRDAGLRWMAAATVLLLMGGAGYFLFLYQKGVPAKMAHSHDVRAPGNNRAVITLAGGQKISLDSLKNGVLARQSGVKVVKLGDGAIAYDQGQSRHPSGEVQYNTLSNPKGSRVVSMTLADGSRVWLNAASSITYPVAFAGDKREVSITGEAYFEVVHHAERPFMVTAGRERVVDIGTRFNISAYADDPVVKTTLVKGAVKVSVLAMQGRRAGKGDVFLKPGQQAMVTAGEEQEASIKVKDVDVDDAIAWKSGRFRFNSVDIAAIMRQAARWYDVDIEYQGKVKGTLSGGIRRSVNISELLRMLALTGRVTFSVEDRKVIVRPVEEE